MLSFERGMTYPRISIATRGCRGKIDGRHLSIIALSEHRVAYMNHKGWYFVNMQGVPFHRCVHPMAWTRARRQGSDKLCFLLLR